MSGGINSTMGALLLGVLLGSVGFGITTVQTFLYIKNFPNDHWLIRVTVYLLLGFDTLHVALCWHMMYYFLILNYNNSPALEAAPWSFDISVVMTVFISVIVQCFYARRMFLLGNRNWFLMILAITLAIPRMVLGMMVAMSFFVNPSFDAAAQHLGPLIGSALGLSTLIDCLVAGSLVFFLRSHRTGFNTTDSFLNELMLWSVNNGLLTSIVSVSVIILFIALHDLVYFAVYIILSKLYINALLATLNYRKVIRGRGVNDDETDISGWRASGNGATRERSLPTFNFGGWSTKGTDASTQLSLGGVRVVTTMTTDRTLDLCSGEDRDAVSAVEDGFVARPEGLQNALAATNTGDRTEA
ncbi:hypothetical protein SCP_1004030 [Sparassis crispa]|uniref:DUF6534 domain-containing protein n=1 Tax=Sparassis crispa TaxID=139825 RepID=A0A401GY63_9APHY|nr:hypothetical protein SCP_1004030 [Sparassis crispa]GBE87156.1 hypothetical protein SCP_1004030 [Sparassis crispa]